MEQHATFDLDAVLRFADLAAAGLAEAREEIDALNVYPVPDGDTGTNMFLTVQAARDAAREAAAGLVAGESDGLAVVLGAYARGALLGARGNSGVILSQLVGALFRRMARAGADERSAVVFAAGLGDAADAAYAAVGRPVEGTMLSVARAAADAAREVVAAPACRLADVVSGAAQAAREALARTPEQMQLLRDAGVVDAGGRGLCVVLDAAETGLTGRRAPAPASVALPRPEIRPVPTGDLTEDGPAYEVMYLLETDDAPGATPYDGQQRTDGRADRPREAPQSADAAADAAPVAALRERLAAIGDSLVVVGGEGLWNVHVHTDDVGAAVEAGIEAGRPRRIRVTHFAEQVARARERRLLERRTGRGVVAVVAGEGLAAVFAEAGAVVIPGGPGRRPSTGEILDAVERTGAAEVVVLPNDPDTLAVAQAAGHAAEESGRVHVVVIPTRAQVQGLAALAVHEPARSFDADVVEMTSAARSTRHGGVTVAARQAMTSAGPCEPGDVLGIVQGDFAVVGEDALTVAGDVLRRLLGGGGELVTLVGGQDAGDLAERCQAWVEREYPGVDVLTYDGGQDRYPLLLAVE